MAVYSVCPSCYQACQDSSPNSLPPGSPYALESLLPTGTVAISIRPSQTFCDHTHSQDGWHAFRGDALLEHLADQEDDRLCREIDFLTNHRFISATFRICSSKTLFVRIYLIPYDLCRVQGKLRVRKDNVLSPARRYLRALLPRVVRDQGNWQGYEPSTRDSPFLPHCIDGRTLAEIYGDLASPCGGTTAGSEGITSRLLDFEDTLGGLGMRSTLYNYQRRSVTAMIRKEMDLCDIPDPLFISLVSMDGRPFYLQPGTLEVLQERPMVATSRGGVLCEELGTGKTVIILTLILATINQLPTPEESVMDSRPVMTPLAFRHFPCPEFSGARKRFLRGKEADIPPSTNRVPSLAELLLHRSRTHPDTSIPDTTTAHGERRYFKRLTLEEQLEALPLGNWRQANIPFYYQYSAEPMNNERTQRRQTNSGPRKMYLSSATLIVVPANLLSQWDREIQKHCEYPLRVLLLRSGTAMPAAISLAQDYDIILMSYRRFAAENSSKELSKLESWIACTCPELSGSRVPNCQCNAPKVSPLLQIRWKRLVIDEGHVSASTTSILVPFTKLMSVERRWIVTGTPTTNLLGLSLGKRTNEEAKNQLDDDDDDLDVNETHSDDIDPSRPPSSQSSSRGGERPRIWTQLDRGDLNRLGNMMTHFIAVPQFIADPKLVHTHVIEPLLDRCGPRPGSIQVLNQIMEMLMVRHRIDDVEKDVILPPVKEESILLDLDPYVIKSYNALQATIAINAIDSQRTDQDYMFHPRNADALQLTVKNMSQLMFWSVDEDLYNVDQLLGDAQDHINTAIKRKVPQEDLALLHNAFRHIRLAAEDQLWRRMQVHEDVPYRIYRMNQRVFNAWTRTPGSESSMSPFLPGYLHLDRLLKIRETAISHPLMSEDHMIERGAEVAEEDRIIRRLYEASLKTKGRKSARHHDEHNASMKVTSAARKASAPETLKEMQMELDISLAEIDEESPTSSPKRRSYIERPSQLIASSPISQVRVGSSASSKLNYVINEVIQYASTEKFLIFSDSELSLAHVAEALELIQVKFLRFTTQIPPQYREQLVLTYETSETYRVFLMGLKHGARGLNLVSASRVIFCEPVWQADVESQAIKRAHRIGQTRPISVKTLAIRGTAEENIVTRRNLFKGSQDKIPKLIEESGMRHYIANPTFIDTPPTLLSTVDVPLINIPPAEDDSSPSGTATPVPHKRVRVEGATFGDLLIESPQKKKKGVRFT